MNKAKAEIVFFALCFIAIFSASFFIYFGKYNELVFWLLTISLILLFLYIIVKLLKKIK